MLIIAASNFLGANLRRHKSRLPDGLGVNALNMRLGMADLRGWNSAYTVVTTGGATPLISAYRMTAATVSDTADWIQWTVDVDVVRSLIANDTTEEIYFTGDGVPKRTDNVLGLPAAPGPAATRTLGIPKPVTAMTVALNTAGGGASETRVYVDTYVNNQDRESAPGTSKSFVCNGGSTVNITALDVTAYSGYADVTLRRIYVSTDGNEFQLLIQQAVATTTSTDNNVRGAVLQSGGDTTKPAWEQPPANMKGLIGLWNGMIGGFVGKSYCVCEPQKPWAWPVEYQSAVMHDIVATGRWLQNWVLLTTSIPYIVNGSSPLAMNEQPIAFNQSCVSKPSAVSLGHGVAWASPSGLCYIGEGSPPIILTEGILTPEQWQALVPSTIRGARFERYYIGFYNDGAAKGFIIDPRDPQGMVFLDFGARGAYYDPVSDRLYLQDTGNTIKRWNSPSGSALSVTFKSGVIRHPRPTGAGAAQVVADIPVSCQVTIWANLLQTDRTFAWTQIFQRTVTTGETFTLPDYTAQEFQYQLVTTGPVQGFVMAEDPTEIP